MKRNRLYTILGIACAIGYSWLFFALTKIGGLEDYRLCFIRNVFGIPCPTCGSTRSAIHFFSGDFLSALWINPIGIVLAIIMVLLPLWLAYDLLLKKDTLLKAYQKTEQTVRVKWIAALLILLVAANWIWNFYKPV